MNVCQLNADNIKCFEKFIPKKYSRLMNNQAVFGFYENDTLWGAAVIKLDGGKAIIQSFCCGTDVPVGECEQLLGAILEKNAKSLGIFEAEYIAEGKEKELKKRDLAMMMADFWPMEGEVSRYVSTLGRIKAAQSKNIDIFNRRDNSKSIMSAQELPDSVIRKYNLKHPDVPFLENESDRSMSYFYIKDNEPVAVIMVSENDENCLVLDWLDMDDGVDSIVNMYLAYECLGQMINRYSEEKRVLIHPFNDEVKSLIKHFDFEPDTGRAIKTRIYTRYFDI